MEDYEIREYRPNRYVKIVDGNVVGRATLGEIECYRLKKRFSDIDTGVVEVSLAITGVSGAVLVLNLPILPRFLSALAFLFGLMASGYLCWFFVLQRIPIARTRFYEFTASRFTSRRTKMSPYLFTFWLLYYYPIMAIKLLKGASYEEQVEYGYLSLLACLALLPIILASIALS